MAMKTLPLFLTFLRIGAFGFGGLGSVIALMERELVHRYAILTSEDLIEALAYTKFLPGSTVVQIVTYVGWRLGGWSVAALATLAFITPAVVMMLLLSLLYTQFTTSSNIQGALQGLNAAIVGLLIVSSYRLGRSIIQDKFHLGLAITAFILAIVFQSSPIAIVIGTGSLSVLRYWLYSPTP